MPWIDNLISYFKAGKPGECPSCGSLNVKVEEHIHGARKSISFRCENCNSADHFDGVNNKSDN